MIFLGRVCPSDFLIVLLSSEHQEFQATIGEHWSDNTASPMLRVWNNLKSVKMGLKALNKNHFIKVADNLTQAKDNLSNIQMKLAEDFSN